MYCAVPRLFSPANKYQLDTTQIVGQESDSPLPLTPCHPLPPHGPTRQQSPYLLQAPNCAAATQTLHPSRIKIRRPIVNIYSHRLLLILTKYHSLKKNISHKVTLFPF